MVDLAHASCVEGTSATAKVKKNIGMGDCPADISDLYTLLDFAHHTRVSGRARANKNLRSPLIADLWDWSRDFGSAW